MTFRRRSLVLPRRPATASIALRGGILLLALVVASVWTHARPSPRAAGARALDALCGDGYCDPLLESEAACYDDCGKCGDGVCTRGAEDLITCSDDCELEPAVSSRR